VKHTKNNAFVQKNIYMALLLMQESLAADRHTRQRAAMIAQPSGGGSRATFRDATMQIRRQTVARSTKLSQQKNEAGW
jgi:hypothetical protein